MIAGSGLIPMTIWPSRYAESPDAGRCGLGQPLFPGGMGVGLDPARDRGLFSLPAGVGSSLGAAGRT